MTFLQHVTIFHGVGVGGGSLVYANTLPMPKRSFFAVAVWVASRPIGNMSSPLTIDRAPHARRHPYPGETAGDRVLEPDRRRHRPTEEHHPTDVAVFFGKPGVEVPDPYFGGRGPARVGCTECGACMTGCRVGAKNTLDRNYLYLAEQLGVADAGRDRGDGGAPAKSSGWLPCRGTPRRPPQGATGLACDQRRVRGRRHGDDAALARDAKGPEGLPQLSKQLGARRAHQQRVARSVSSRRRAPKTSATASPSRRSCTPTSTATSSRCATAPGPTSSRS